MTLLINTTAAAFMLVNQSTVTPSQDCDAGYQTFLGNFSKLVHVTSAPDASDALRKSLSVYDACKAGDAFSPAASWIAIIKDLESKTAK